MGSWNKPTTQLHKPLDDLREGKVGQHRPMSRGEFPVMQTTVSGTIITQGEATLELPTEKWALQVHGSITRQGVNLADLKARMSEKSDISIAKRIQHDENQANNTSKVGLLIDGRVRYIAMQRVAQLTELDAVVGSTWRTRVATAIDAAELDRYIHAMEGALYDVFGVKATNGNGSTAPETPASGDASATARFQDDEDEG